MCGIVGYTGKDEAGPILLDGLLKLEYRGYDSSGVSVYDDTACEVEIVKAKGRLKELIAKTDSGRSLRGHCGIGHTRWATHGEPTEQNAHPHFSDDKNVVGVHNGIIENYQELRQKLIDNGYSFYSETDTEVAIKLIDYYYKKYFGTPVDAINRALVRIRGAYAFAIMFRDYPDEIYAARLDSPLVVGVGEDEGFLASDVCAVMNHTRRVYYPDNYQIARLRAGEASFFNLNGDEINLSEQYIDWDVSSADMGGYEHFMMKEIHEQPKVILDTLDAYAPGSEIDLGLAGIDEERLKGYPRIYIVACGTAYHVGVAAKYIFEAIAGVPVETDIASEFRYREPYVEEGSLMIIITQSGETADTLAALRMAKAKGIDTLAIVNVVGSTIAREADSVMYTRVGPEIAVASTKAYSGQLINMYLLALKTARLRGKIGDEEVLSFLKALRLIPSQIEELLKDRENIQRFATKISSHHDIYFIGRGIDYAISLEGSLKTKEVSYIHSEAYAAGELKHGPISLIDQGTLVIALATQDELFEKMLTNIEEVRSRGAYVCTLTNSGNFNVEESSDFSLYIPRTNKFFTASLAIIPLQLIAYYVSISRGVDVDKPRNLAKSVTVE